MEYGLTNDGSSIPSDTLKAEFLKLLESEKGRALEVLSKVLKIDTIQHATVREVISRYEECFGHLSLDNWKNIFQQLGHLDYFHQLVTANQTALMAAAADTPMKSQPVDNQQQDQSFIDKSSTPRGTTGTGECTNDGSKASANDHASLPTAQAKPIHPGAIPKTQSIPQLSKAQDKDPDISREMPQAAVAENFSINQLAVSELDLNFHATTRETAANITRDTYQSPREEWPPWSLPPPPPSWSELPSEENLTNDKNDTAGGKSGHDSTVEEAAESDSSSVEDNAHESNRAPLTNAQSLSTAKSSLPSHVPKVETETSQCENVTVTALEKKEMKETLTASGLHTDSSQQSKNTVTPARPITPEAAHSSCNTSSVVTGHHRSFQNNRGPDDSSLPGSEGETGDQVRNGAEHYDDTENNGLLTELLKENESLRLDVAFSVRELREKQLECANLRTECYHLEQQLEETRGELQTEREEHTRHLEENAVLEDESQQLIRMTEEMCALKEQECSRVQQECILKEQERAELEKHIRQIDQRYEDSTGCMQSLSREWQECSGELQLAVGQVQGLLQERVQNLEMQHERLRLDSESRLEERMAEVAQAFNNAETDKVKRLKQKLAREKRKGRKTEERNKALLKENQRLQALIRQLRSKEEGSIPSGGLCEDGVGENHESSSPASSEEEGDEQPGSSNYSQQSDSDSSEDEMFEDALDELDSS